MSDAGGKQKVSRTLTDEERQKIIEKAAAWTGTPYRRFNPTNQEGADCPGSTSRIYTESGLQYDPSTPPGYWSTGKFKEEMKAGAHPNLREIPLNEAKKGDILLWPGHMAIYNPDGGENDILTARDYGKAYGPGMSKWWGSEPKVYTFIVEE